MVIMKPWRCLVGFMLLATMPGSRARAAAGRPSLFQRIAVLVCVDNYKEGAKDERLRLLKGGLYDLRVMIDIVKRKFVPTEVIVCFNDGDAKQKIEGATRQNILGVLQKVASKVKKADDHVLFYFSGLGSVDAQGDPTLCPYDTRLDNSDHAIKVTELAEWVKQLKSDNVTLILDCAFTEPPAGKGAPIRPKFLARSTVAQPERIEAALRSVVKHKGVLLTASQPDEGAWERLWGEDAGGNKIWTGIFTRCLKGQIDDLGEELISYRDLITRVQIDVSGYIAYALQSNPEYRQRPQCYGQPAYTQRALFRSNPPPGARPVPVVQQSISKKVSEDGPFLHLWVGIYGTDAKRGQDLRQRLRNMRYSQFVLWAEQPQTADVSLHIYQTPTELRAYLVDVDGNIVGQTDPTHRSHAFLAKPEEFDRLVSWLEKHLTGLWSYRWLPSVETPGRSLQIKTFRIEEGESVPAKRLINVTLETNQDGVWTLLEVNREGVVRPIVQRMEVKGNEKMTILLRTFDRGRYLYVSVVTPPSEKEVDYRDILRDASQHQRWTQKRLARAPQVGTRGSGSDLPLSEDLVSPDRKGDEASLIYAIKVVRLAVEE
ncbi:MAG: caspase family protein [Abditibacteriales bacterium]|nr:caspase family protein [Abditibacteriales bacterium]MDW8365822.1 caspase family protein [Abditibacteriales bacterium]